MPTFTLNGTFGISTTAYARKVMEEGDLAVASDDLPLDGGGSRYLIRKNAVDGTPDTTLPLSLSFGPVAVAKVVFLRVTNYCTLQLSNGEGGTVTMPVGNANHPEALIVLMGVELTSITVTAVTVDQTEIRVRVAGV